jgi:hypothetical protein
MGLLDRIQENTEGWENDKVRKSGINYDYESIKSFMGTDDFHNVSAIYGLDSQILANCFKAFASYLDVPKKDWNNYVTSQDFIKFWSEFFCFCFVVLIEISQGFKTFKLV